MARERVVEALQFDFADEEPSDRIAESEVEAALGPPPPPGASEVLSGRERRARGLKAARQALESGMTLDGGEDPQTSRGETSATASPSDSAIGIAAFYNRLRQALRAEFDDELWVTGEIRKVTVSKGHRYIELADHEEETSGPPPAAMPGRPSFSNRAGATLEVACWSREWPVIAARLDAVGVELAPGLVVRVKGRVSIWEAGARIRFSVSDVDVEALVGGIAAARRKLLTTLEQEGVIEANRLLAVPLVPLRVGLVTSAGSEAYRDFTGQLSRSGLVFDVRLQPSLVQGADAPFQLAAALAALQAAEIDLIVVVRGGGAKGDLAAFDHELVARAIVTSRYPVWTGIGHTGDRSVTDELAQRACSTPTACGEAVVTAVCTYLDDLDAKAARLHTTATRAMELAVRELSGAVGALTRAARHELQSAATTVAGARARTERGAALALAGCAGTLWRRSGRLSHLATSGLSTAEGRLGRQRAMLDAFHPQRQLERGWSLTKSASGAVVRSVRELAPGESLVTVLADGSVTSRTEEVRSEKRQGTLSVGAPPGELNRMRDEAKRAGGEDGN